MNTKPLLRTRRFHVYFTDEEWAAFLRLLAQKQTRGSQFVRELVMAAARESA